MSRCDDMLEIVCVSQRDIAQRCVCGPAGHRDLDRDLAAGKEVKKSVRDTAGRHSSSGVTLFQRGLAIPAGKRGKGKPISWAIPNTAGRLHNSGMRECSATRLFAGPGPARLGHARPSLLRRTITEKAGCVPGRARPATPRQRPGPTSLAPAPAGPAGPTSARPAPPP
jgi:hypothetical protein